VIKPLNLYFLQNCALDTEWLFLKNNLYGEHINENSNVEGHYSFYDKLERLNLAINIFNQPINPFSIQFFINQREEIRDTDPALTVEWDEVRSCTIYLFIIGKLKANVAPLPITNIVIAILDCLEMMGQ
jgi:hypothetical protein